MTREEARNDLKSRRLSNFIKLDLSPKAGRGMYVCPICHSGTGKSQTGALHESKLNGRYRYYCFSNNCFTDKGEDTLGALRTILGCDESEALERAGYKLERPASGYVRPTGRAVTPDKAAEKDSDYADFYDECHLMLRGSKDALDYLHSRGISDESIDRFNLGYCAEWKHEKAGDRISPTRRIIIPRSSRTYVARSIDPPTSELEAQYAKQVQGRQKDLFFIGNHDGETVFVVEGELDAISLFQAGAKDIVAIGTITNTKVFLEEAKKHRDAVYILALDNDPTKDDGSNPGIGAQKKLHNDMVQAGLGVMNVNPASIYGKAKDANEAFTNSRGHLEKAVGYLTKLALDVKCSRDEEREADLSKRTGVGMLDSFVKTVTTTRDFEPIPTGISDIDRALHGGFVRRSLVMLGAAPGMGKTAFSQWIFENMAHCDQDVLYINLEMDRNQLLARSISRYLWKYRKRDMSALSILRGYQWSDDEKRDILYAMDLYKETVAGHFVYNPDGVDNSLDSIMSAMQSEVARVKALGRREPIFCIDYLQLIDPGNRDAIEGMKAIIYRLKDFAIKNNTVVYVIVATNRASNRSGIAEMESGRDTSNIEYSADLMLGMSYTAIEDKRTYIYEYENDKGEVKQEKKVYDLETIRRLKREAYRDGEDVPMVCNEITVRVLKNRFGEPERRADFIFDGKHSIFELKEFKEEDGYYPLC